MPANKVPRPRDFEIILHCLIAPLPSLSHCPRREQGNLITNDIHDGLSARSFGPTPPAVVVVGPRSQVNHSFGGEIGCRYVVIDLMFKFDPSHIYAKINVKFPAAATLSTHPPGVPRHTVICGVPCPLLHCPPKRSHALGVLKSFYMASLPHCTHFLIARRKGPISSRV